MRRFSVGVRAFVVTLSNKELLLSAYKLRGSSRKRSLADDWLRQQNSEVVRQLLAVGLLDLDGLGARLLTGAPGFALTPGYQVGGSVK